MNHKKSLRNIVNRKGEPLHFYFVVGPIQMYHLYHGKSAIEGRRVKRKHLYMSEFKVIASFTIMKCFVLTFHIKNFNFRMHCRFISQLLALKCPENIKYEQLLF